MEFEFPDAPSPPDAPKVKVYKFRGTGDMKWTPEADMAFRSSEKAKESAATAKKRAKLDKERAKLEEKRVKLEGERAKLEAERRALEGGKRSFMYSNTFRAVPGERVLRINADNIKISNNGTSIIASGIKNTEGMGDMKIYIDGKESTKEQMQALKPESIRSMNVDKRNTDGKSSGEIRIKTKE